MCIRDRKYTNLNRRVRILEEHGYIERVGTRKTQAGFQATLYQLTAKAYLAILLNKVNMDDYIQKASEESALTMLATLIAHTSTFEVSSISDWISPKFWGLF